MEGDVCIRDMQNKDYTRIIEIDKQNVGKNRAPSWNQKVYNYLETYPLKRLVAEVRHEVVGFLLGDITGWEYGFAPCGWIEIIGIAPEYQRKGIGKKLIAAFVDHCRSLGIKSVHALINKNDKQLTNFLQAAFFKRGRLVDFELEI
jgi:ribosomal protein S18 acetylase RimI-like enzyme